MRKYLSVMHNDLKKKLITVNRRTDSRLDLIPNERIR